MAGVNRIRVSSDTASEVIRAAIAAHASLSFRYERADGVVTNHNAVYPKQLSEGGPHPVFHAYCHFTRDERTFRVDRVRAVRIRRRLPHIPFRRDLAGAVVMIVAIFLALFFFFSKDRSQRLRKQIPRSDHLHSRTKP